MRKAAVASLSLRALRELRELRQNFLESSKSLAQDYWQNPDLIELYDRTLGFRNQWKWAAVLGELNIRNLEFRGRTLLDWGCGSGAASQSFLEAMGPYQVHLTLVDRSPLAVKFAQSKIQNLIVGLSDFKVTTQSGIQSTDRFESVLLSHVHNELEAGVLNELLTSLFRQSDSFIWIESGTPEAARFIGLVRERAREAGFEAIAPCTHQKPCPLQSDSSVDWCHRFAWAPPHTHHDSDWAHLCRDLGFDKRRVAFSFVVMQRKGAQVWVESQKRLGSRILGEPRVYKGYSQLLLCSEGQVSATQIQKRTNQNLYRQTQDFSKTLGKLPEVDVKDS